MHSRIGNSSIPNRHAAQALRRAWPMLVAAGALGLLATGVRLHGPPASLSSQCAAWDSAAGAALAALIADRSETAEAGLGDALFRLRRARRNCRHDWVGLARLDYDALIDGRYGQPR